MKLSAQEAQLFFKLRFSFMTFVNERLQVVPGVDTPEQYRSLPLEELREIRKEYQKNTGLIDLFVDANPFDFNAEELDIVSSWRHEVGGDFYVLRYLKSHTVFLSTSEPPIAFGVISLTNSFEEMIGRNLPFWTNTVLLPFRDKIVYDGLLDTYNISFGPGIRRSFNDSYKEAKERLGIVTSLPMLPSAEPVSRKAKKTRPQNSKSAREDVRDALRVIVDMTDQFCRECLNDEYAELCRQLAEKLSRKRPSPLLRGKPTTWACGIVRTVGWVNFLDDPAQVPHLRMSEIDDAFCVGHSTGAASASQIRKILKMNRFDPHWTLPSKMDDNLMIWMLQVNGFVMDIRRCPREAQEVAFEKGLIPYIPADRA